MDRTKSSLNLWRKDSSSEIIDHDISKGCDNLSKEQNHAYTYTNSRQELAVSDTVERGSASTEGHNQKHKYCGVCCQSSTVPIQVVQDSKNVEPDYSKLQLPEKTQIGSKNRVTGNWEISNLNNDNNFTDCSNMRDAGIQGSSSILASKYSPVLEITSQDAHTIEQSQKLATSWPTWWATGARHSLVNKKDSDICVSQVNLSSEIENLLSSKFDEPPCFSSIKSISSTPWFSWYPALLLSILKRYLETKPPKELPVIINSSNTQVQCPSPHTRASQSNGIEQGILMPGMPISSDDAILAGSFETPINAKITRSENNLMKHISKLSKQALFTTRDDMIESPRSELIQESYSSAQTQPLININPPNILLPSLRSTYGIYEPPTVIEKVYQVLHLKPLKPDRRVFLTEDYPILKKAVAIGIHGFFPAPLLRIVIGQPTGTSVRFANHASEAIRRWISKHNVTDCEIEKIALEGEGKIADRVENLWKILLQRIDQLRKADLIFVACHSQGVPVAIMLVAKLIEFGVIDLGRICVCAMGKFPLTLGGNIVNYLQSWSLTWTLLRPEV